MKKGINVQTNFKVEGRERETLLKALKEIGKRNKNGEFSKRAKDLQRLHGNSMAIHRKLKQQRHIKHD